MCSLRPSESKPCATPWATPLAVYVAGGRCHNGTVTAAGPRRQPSRRALLLLLVSQVLRATECQCPRAGASAIILTSGPLVGTPACERCEDGQFVAYQPSQGLATLTCAACTAGFVCVVAATGPTAGVSTAELPCASSTYSAPGQSNCTACEAGYLCGGASNRAPCAPGTYSNPGWDPEGAIQCAACEHGYYCPGASYRSTCGNGTAPSASKAQCDTCPPGKLAGAGAGACSNCTAGRVANQSGSSSCLGCEPGSYSTSGQAECTLCPIGSMCPGSAGRSVCPLGSSSPRGSGSCTQVKPTQITVHASHPRLPKGCLSCFVRVGSAGRESLARQPAPAPARCASAAPKGSSRARRARCCATAARQRTTAWGAPTSGRARLDRTSHNYDLL